MSPLKKIFYNACSILPISSLQKINPVHTLLPYQHTVSNNFLPHIKHLYSYKNIRQFHQDLEVLLKYYRPIEPDDLLAYIRQNASMPKNTFLLTFDDGFKEIYEIIAPILEAKGIPAIFFINPAFIDNKELFFRCKTSLLIDQLVNTPDKKLLTIYRTNLDVPAATVEKLIERLKIIKLNDTHILDEIASQSGYSFDDFLKDKRPFLTKQELLSLKERGFTIGAHGWNHPYYEQLEMEAQISQTVDSCNFVQQEIKMDKKYFSFPYSDKYLSQELFDNLKKTDIDLFFGIQNQKNELNNNILHRFNAERPDIGFEKQLKGLLALNAVKRIMRKNVSVKRN